MSLEEKILRAELMAFSSLASEAQIEAMTADGAFAAAIQRAERRPPLTPEQRKEFQEIAKLARDAFIPEHDTAANERWVATWALQFDEAPPPRVTGWKVIPLQHRYADGPGGSRFVSIRALGWVSTQVENVSRPIRFDEAQSYANRVAAENAWQEKYGEPLPVNPHIVDDVVG